MIQIPVERFRPVVEAWAASFDTLEQAYMQLGGYPDTWRKRLSNSPPQGWWRRDVLDETSVDEFLSAAGLTYLWWTEFDDLLPARPVLSVAA